ncbi:hypothetical protein FB45DRAFT_280795 [Roridomyces roridus]|uniref:T6SS Phospholipase effector Tle1-like catalytic domain-containing protein n=1 Tax=Roridomyces roridus TaxID=1738132 RepID=A0AAD7CAA4_9AGAR|nr:hypothetical protein FB45DRAFT_280795 [Roridomyces roridus]
MPAIPPTPPAEPVLTSGRTLILCFDGTAGQYDGYNTNPVKLFALLKKDDFREQLCYYQSGVGTYVTPGMVSPFFDWAAKLLDEAFAIYLNDHLLDGYRFLMENYHRGDKICLFGFSRGAYTARGLAGMLHKVGLLPRDNQEQIPFAFKMYKDTSAAGMKTAAGYKDTFCQDVTVDFMGIWETVDSVGVLMGRTLPFTGLNTSIKTLRHALALDEHRVRFQPYLCEPKDAPTPKGQMPEDVLEVWFAGAHSDVGGSSTSNDVQRSLSDITLRWMVREAMLSGCEVRWDKAALARAGIPSSVDEDWTALEETDAAQPLYDELKTNPAWWALEVLPLPWSVQDEQGVWHWKFGLHLGKGRTVVDAQPKFHYTVKARMANEALKYKPKAQWVAGSESYVE